MYIIRNSQGMQGGAWDVRYASLRAARRAIRGAMGWRRCYLSGAYTVDGGEAVSAYETSAECVEDETGQYAPQIVVMRDVSLLRGLLRGGR